MKTELLCRGEIYPIQPCDRICSNATIVEAWNKTILMYRIGRDKYGRMGAYTKIGISELTPDFKVTSAQLVSLCPQSLQEDPRMIFYKDRLVVFFISDPGWSMWHTILNQDYKRVKSSLCYYGTTSEKNWVPFVLNDDLYIIYKHMPFTILKLDKGWHQVHQSTPARLDLWRFGSISGGTPPVFRNGRFYSFFHSHNNPSNWPARIYSVGCCTFDRNFEVLGITKEPIMQGIPEENRIACVFPAGAICRDDKWIISYGFQDWRVKIATIDCEEIDRMLI